MQMLFLGGLPEADGFGSLAAKRELRVAFSEALFLELRAS
jgi:hypothetical protein